ncbi:MAG TPA: hypothetical protein PKA90_07410 [Ignavibacteria bacterium]|nr:hypothetical protein [Ignavibacteria bacterium]HMR40243.1 hypothetical protein [Ignavibacteria bacterium]
MEIINNKLVQLLESFTPKEIEQFAKFISSPYITEGRNYTPFLEHILKKKEMNGSRKISEPVTEITGARLSRQTLKNRYSELYKLGEEFLAHKWLKENNSQRDMIVLEKLHEKKLMSLFRSKYRETLRTQKSKKLAVPVLKELSEIYEINGTYLLDMNKNDIIYDEYYEKSVINLCYHLITIFENGIEFLQQESENIKYDPNYVAAYLKTLNIENFMKGFINSDKTIMKLVAMNYNLYMAFSHPEDENFYQTTHKIFTEINDQLADSYKIYLFIYLINYCIKKYNAGDLSYIQELFKLYNEKLGQNLVSDLKNSSYSFNHFRDYVFIGLQIKDFDWVGNFIKQYSEYLPDNLKEDEVKLSYAKLEFEKKNFERSLSFLNDVRASQYLLYIDTAVYKLYNYYELGEFEESYAVMTNLKNYFKNNKDIPRIHHIRNLNFLKIYLRLIKYRTGFKKEDAGLIKRDFQMIDQTTGKNWLGDKINEIIN